MPNQIDANGLQTDTQSELYNQLVADLQAIYGADINVDPDSPDGQLLNIFIQSVLDLEDLLTQINSGFDPDQAIGRILDQRVAINGIQRLGGTYTLTDVDVTVSQAVSLTGINDDPDNPYTVRDAAGNQWQLVASVNVSNGSYPYTTTLSFRAANPGAVLTTPNTITIPVTIVLGVTSVNNPATYTSLGINEETDAALRIRREKSVSLPSQGYLAGLRAALLNIDGIDSVFIYENTTGTTDADSVPGHSIWVIISGTAASVDIATAIYNKRNAGCGQKTATSNNYVITQVDGSPFTIYWDVVVDEDLYIQFDASSIDGVNPPNTVAILAQLPTLLVPGVNEELNINGLATIVQEIDPNCLVTNAGLSLAALGPFTNTLSPSAKNKRLAVSSARINITVV